jgi:protein-S-isoprenylcysteine O-methyltransferase Ste14
MDLIPEFRFGIVNAWLPLVVYFLGLIASVVAFPADKRKKLFLEPQYPVGHPRWFVLLVGRIAAVAFVLLSLVIPLRPGMALFTIGAALYVIGYTVVMVALADFRRAPADRIVNEGLYRYSRNPQWLGLVGVYVGTALATGAVLPLALVLVLVGAYHVQILLEEEICLSAYGERYREYMRRVPRYVGV